MNKELTLKEVYKIFCVYWNSEHRLWVLTSQQKNYNIIISTNDFFHFCQIDKIQKINCLPSTVKQKYVKTRIEREKITFSSIERALINTNQQKHFELKKKALICLATCMSEQTKIFHKICFTSNHLFINVKPDFVLINEINDDRCLLLCALIKKTNPQFLENLSHVKSLMYCNHKHHRFQKFSQFKCIELEKVCFIKKKEAK